MRKRKKKDKRVLKSRYSKSSNNEQKRRLSFGGGQTQRFPHYNVQGNGFSQSRKPRKTSKNTMILIIIALLAFVVGAGIGISMAISGPSDNNTVVDDGVTFENVTVQMTSNLNGSGKGFVDDGVYNIDYNNAEDVVEYNLTNNSKSY